MALFIANPRLLVLGTLFSCEFYALVLLGFLFFRHSPSRGSSGSRPILALALWLLIAPPLLYAWQFFLSPLPVYLLVLLLMMIALHLYMRTVDTFMKAHIFMQSISSGLVLLCTYNTMPLCIYNLLVLHLTIPTDSPLLGISCYAAPFLWIALDCLITWRLKKGWQRFRQQSATR